MHFWTKPRVITPPQDRVWRCNAPTKMTGVSHEQTLSSATACHFWNVRAGMTAVPQKVTQYVILGLEH